MSEDDIEDGSRRRTVVVDASVVITLAALDRLDLLYGVAGQVLVPERVTTELTDDRSATALDRGRERGRLRVERATEGLDDARSHLGVPASDASGDVGVLAHGLALERPVVVVSDDKPLRQTCKTLSIPVSGSIGVVVRAVERCDLGPAEAKDLLYAMDEVGARLSASLVRRAERLIDDADSG